MKAGRDGHACLSGETEHVEEVSRGNMSTTGEAVVFWLCQGQEEGVLVARVWDQETASLTGWWENGLVGR